MSHPFGDLLSHYLHRKHGLSQAKLADGILQAPAVISDMCKGRRLSGPQARARVLHIIAWLRQQGVLSQLAEANALLDVAGMAALHPNGAVETTVIAQLVSTPLSPQGVAAAPGSAKANARRQALPVPLTPLIGRAQTVASICRHILSETCRLLTLVGPPGVGKTRLALQAAMELTTAFADGLFFVPLATLRDATLAPAMICQALGLQEKGLPPLDHLKLYLYDKQTLLVLDNLEQLLEIAPALVELLAACPQLQLLTTSRAPLRVRAERQFPVLPLTLPNLNDLPPSLLLTQADAITLFVERGQQVLPSFALTPENATTVATICTRLDGLPLAIELVAARLKVLSPTALLARLNGALLLSSDGLRDSTPRQQTLRDAIQWSYDLLSSVEQRLLAQLGIFTGGFTLAAAEMLCRDELPPPDAVLTGLTSLVDKSLLQATPGQAEPRFTMLETIHEYALEQLAASGELPTVQRCHAEYCLYLAETAEPHLRTGEQITWLKRLDAERANLRAALTWSISTTGDPVLGLRLVNALGYYWYLRALYGEGSRWLDAVLACADEGVDASLRAWALYNNCLLAVGLDDSARGIACGEAALALAHRLHDQRLLCHVAIWLKHHVHVRDGHEENKEALQEGLQRARTLADPWLIAYFSSFLAYLEPDPTHRMRMQAAVLAQMRAVGDRILIACALKNLGDTVTVLGDYGQASVCYSESLLLARQLEEIRSLFVILDCGNIAAAQGDAERAAACYQEARLFAQQAGTLGLLGWVEERLGRLAQRQNNPITALQHFQKGLRFVQGLDHRLFVGPCLVMMSMVADLPGSPLGVMQAAQLLGAANAMFTFEHLPFTPTDRLDVQRTLDATSAQLADPLYAAAWAAGQQMTLDEAVAYALALACPGQKQPLYTSDNRSVQEGGHDEPSIW